MAICQKDEIIQDLHSHIHSLEDENRAYQQTIGKVRDILMDSFLEGRSHG